ncbi:MAG: ABC-type transport system substrate-binding protein [Myxococcota bacterium]|jgi:ABC-type transport system substrate-binding protein
MSRVAMGSLRACIVALVCTGLLVGCRDLAATNAPPVQNVVDGALRDLEPALAAPIFPVGEVVLAYPEPHVSWWARDADDVAAGDLASIWMLPLYRTDPLGRLVPALAIDAQPVDVATELSVPDGAAWGVRVTLAAGSWSDGAAVEPGDVVATADALRAARPAEWSAFVAAVPEDASVVLWFDRPYAGWPWLLSVAPGVLPAHVLAQGGLAAFDDALPVTGGWFTLASLQPELRAAFEAHPTGPLGPPALASLTVLTVPNHDVALGLLAAGEVAVVLGYVALDPETRAAAVSDVTSVSAFGGTRFELVWDADGDTDVDDRRALAARIQPAPVVEGLLRDVGRQPGGARPALTAVAPPPPDGVPTADVLLQLPRTVEGLGLIARLLQGQASLDDVAIELVRVDPPEHVLSPIEVDGRLRVARVSPGRSMAGLLSELGLEPAAGVTADAAGTGGIDPAGPQVAAPPLWDEALAELATSARLTVIAEVAVVHTWRASTVEGVRPSGWPGVGLWNVGVWAVPAAG